MLKSLRSKRHKAFMAMLVQARKDAGLEQTDVAALLKKPQSFVSKTERGDRRLDVIEFITLIEALGANPSKIIEELRKVDP